jgi:tetratricopeptide (TPR) repeat protein
MKKYAGLLFLILLSLAAAGQDADHPATALLRMREAFNRSARIPDYPRMLSLMDSMMFIKTSIDRTARPRIYQNYKDYAHLFGKTAEGRVVHYLFLYSRFPEKRGENEVQLPATPVELSGIPASHYQKLLLNDPQVYPCYSLYELALFVVEDYPALIPLLEQGRGNVPHNLIAARYKQLLSYTVSRELKKAGLDSLLKRFPYTEPISYVYLEKARLLTEDGYYEEALRISREAYRRFPGSPVRESFSDMKDFLTQPSIDLQIKKQLYPGSVAEIIITRRNIKRYKLKILDSHGKRWFGKTYRYPDFPVYREVMDTVHISIPPEGSYTLAIKKGKTTTESSFYSGKVATMFRTRQDTGYVYATDLQSGKPLDKVEVRFVNDTRDPFTLEPDGFTPMEVRTGDSFRLSIPSENPAVPDTFSVPVTVRPWDFQYGEGEREITSASLFTDRKLYRNQDTLFFKGIVTTCKDGKCHTTAGEKYTVVLRNNANYRDTLDTVHVQTNDFGSFSGYFPPGSTRMNGSHSITFPGASVHVRIEAYTRPSFTLALSPVRGAYAFYDTIVQQGVVFNYAGFPLANASVQCRVFFRSPFRPFYIHHKTSENKEGLIFTDTLKTSEKGEFRLAFPALRPPGDTSLHGMLELDITAVDITGETQQKTALLPVSGFRYTIHTDFLHHEGEVRNNILIREKGPYFRFLVKSSNGFDQDRPLTCHFLQQGDTVFTDILLSGQMYQPPWDSMKSGRWEIAAGTDGAAPYFGSFFLLSLKDTISPADTALFFCPLEEDPPSFLLGTVDKPVYVLAEWYARGSLISKNNLFLEPGMKIFSFPGLPAGDEPPELRLVAVRDGQYLEFRHRWEQPAEESIPLHFVSLRRNTEPYSLESFGIVLPKKENAEVLVSIFNKSTDRLAPNQFVYRPAREPYMPIPAIRHHFMNLSTSGSKTRSVPGLYYAAGRNAVASDMITQEESVSESVPQPDETGTEIIVRSDFEETLAFLPHLIPDSIGTVPVTFRTNGLLGTFRILTLAHTPDGKSTAAEDTLLVSKEVMAMPSFPAYLREYDRIELTVPVINLTSSPVEGIAFLKIGENEPEKQPACLLASERILFKWDYTTPSVSDERVPLVKITAGFQSPLHSDAQQNILPVLPMKEPITRARTRILTGNDVVTLVKQNKDSRATLDVTTPFLAAVRALPSVCEPSGSNLTAWVSAFYANNTGARLLQEFPGILPSLDKVPEGQASAFQKNARLTEILISQTPWADYPGREAERIHRLKRLGDPRYMRSFNEKALEYFGSLQRPDGGFSWFPGMESSYTLTLYFLEVTGNMKENGIDLRVDDRLQVLAEKAVYYADSLFAKRYSEIHASEVTRDVLTYFYVRSAFPEIQARKGVHKVTERYSAILKESWKGATVAEKVFLAVILERTDQKEALARVLSSLREFAVFDADQGCYFPNAVFYDGLMHSEMKTHALLLRLFKNDPLIRNGITRWLLDRKENQMWQSGPSTTDVIHALLYYGNEETAEMPLYETIVRGTTYTARNRSRAQLYVTLYEQTLEDLRGAQPYANGMVIRRAFYRLSDNSLITEKDTLKRGERIMARYFVTNEHARSFVHMNVSHAACLIPESETSGYGWNASGSWYREVKTGSTQYFFQTLSGGEHVMEERFYVTQTGSFQQGSIRIQSLFAPRYRGFSPGKSLEVAN